MFACGGMLAACAGSACMTATCAGCGAVGSAISKVSARALYTVLFLLTTVLAVVMRDYAQPMMRKIPWISTFNIEPSPQWFGAQAVYRISFGNFMFFGALSLMLINVRSRSDPRDRHIHHGAWALKFTAWVVCNVLPFFFPNDAVGGYTWLARVGSGVFLAGKGRKGGGAAPAGPSLFARDLVARIFVLLNL